MKKILAISGSNTENSINHELLVAAVNKFPQGSVDLVRLIDIDVPIFSFKEEEKGIPQIIKDLYKKIKEADGIIFSSPEHNGLPSAFLKNIIDWLSRVEMKFLSGKQVLLISASPGGNGGNSHLKIFANILPFFGGKFAGDYSLGFFDKKFNMKKHSVSDQAEDLKLGQTVKDYMELVGIRNNHTVYQGNEIFNNRISLS